MKNQKISSKLVSSPAKNEPIFIEIVNHRRFLKERVHSSKEASLLVLHQQATVATKNFDGEHYFRVLHEMVGFYIRLEVRLMLACCPNEQRIKSTSCIEQMY
tara:strand:+ start:1265 stop:1570 length:306 start_codon:yes stop_codon:yes gene_type:complete